MQKTLDSAHLVIQDVGIPSSYIGALVVLEDAVLEVVGDKARYKKLSKANSKAVTRMKFHFKKTNEGTDKRLNDPSLPENWAATDLSKDPKARFTDTVDYENYIKEMELIKEKSELLRE